MLKILVFFFILYMLRILIRSYLGNLALKGEQLQNQKRSTNSSRTDKSFKKKNGTEDDVIDAEYKVID